MAKRRKSKSKKGLIIGIVSGVVVIGTVVAIMATQKKTVPKKRNEGALPFDPNGSDAPNYDIPQPAPSVPEAAAPSAVRVYQEGEAAYTGLQPLGPTAFVPFY